MPRVLAASGYTIADSSWDAVSLRVATVMGPSIVDTDLRPYLPRMTKPLLAIAGKQDPVVLPGPLTGQFAAWGGPKRLLVFEQSDHFLFAEEPERLARELGTFVDGLRR
jgi:pimeloyl-ACP methyl ester carboxylesterase